MADEHSALKQGGLRGGAEAQRACGAFAAETPDSHETRRRILSKHAAQSALAHADADAAGMRGCPRAELAQQHPVFSLPRRAGPRDKRPSVNSGGKKRVNAEEHGAHECEVRSCKCRLKYSSAWSHSNSLWHYRKRYKRRCFYRSFNTTKPLYKRNNKKS